MIEREFAHHFDSEFRGRAALATERDRLVRELRERLKKLDEQARMFLPLIAIALIFAIPVFSKSPAKFLVLLVNPFVSFPLGFCVFHLASSLREIVKAKKRIRDWDRIVSDSNEIGRSR